jgi:hypothetical protein
MPLIPTIEFRVCKLCSVCTSKFTSTFTGQDQISTPLRHVMRLPSDAITLSTLYQSFRPRIRHGNPPFLSVHTLCSVIVFFDVTRKSGTLLQAKSLKRNSHGPPGPATQKLSIQVINLTSRFLSDPDLEFRFDLKRDIFQ